MTIGAGIVDAFLLWHDKLDSGGYVTVTLGTIGVFIAAEAYEKRRARKEAASA